MHVCCAVLRYQFRTQKFRKSLKFFGTSIASLDPETVQLPAFCMYAIRQAMPLRERVARQRS